MFKKLLYTLVLIFFIDSTSYLTVTAENAQSNIVGGKLKLQQMDTSILDTNKKIASLSTEVEKLNAEIKKNNVQIDNNNAEIKAKKAGIEGLNKEIKSNQQLANKRLRAIYINGYNESFISVLLSSKNFSDFLYKYDAVKNIISFDNKVFNNLSSKKFLLTANMEDINNKNQQLRQLKASNADTVNQLNKNKNNLENLIISFNKEKASALQIIKDNEESLISHSIAVIDSNTASIPDIKNSLSTLNSLVSQITTASVKKKAQDYINTGNKKLTLLIASNSSSGSGVNTSYKASYTMSATAYTGGAVTALGLKPIRDPANLSTIAVDPSIIPLGTKVYIPGYGNAICSDTGNSIKGNIIDLYMNSEQDCYSWGVKSVTLYIIAYPGEW